MIYVLTSGYSSANESMCIGGSPCVAPDRVPDYPHDRCWCRSASGRCPVANMQNVRITGQGRQPLINSVSPIVDITN